MLGLGVNSLFEIDSKKRTSTASTRPQTTAASLYQFQQSEGAVSRKPFKTFYTQAQDNEVDYERKNKFQGKSSYLAYVPANNNVNERIMESKWF